MGWWEALQRWSPALPWDSSSLVSSKVTRIPIRSATPGRGVSTVKVQGQLSSASLHPMAPQMQKPFEASEWGVHVFQKQKVGKNKPHPFCPVPWTKGAQEWLKQSRIQDLHPHTKTCGRGQTRLAPSRKAQHCGCSSCSCLQSRMLSWGLRGRTSSRSRSVQGSVVRSAGQAVRKPGCVRGTRPRARKQRPV